MRQAQSKVKYFQVFQHHHAFHSKPLNELVHVFLSAVNIKSADGEGNYYIKYSSGSNGKHYNIDSRLVEPGYYIAVPTNRFQIL